MSDWPEWMMPDQRADAARAESVITTALKEFEDQVLTPELSLKIRDRLARLNSGLGSSSSGASGGAGK
jgi:hypothetical protein